MKLQVKCLRYVTNGHLAIKVCVIFLCGFRENVFCRRRSTTIDDNRRTIDAHLLQWYSYRELKSNHSWIRTKLEVLLHTYIYAADGHEYKVIYG